MYIRTKDGRILDFDKLNEVSKLSIDMAEEPIREAKTIEDLCDEFVYVNKVGKFDKSYVIHYDMPNHIFTEPTIKEKIAYIKKYYYDNLNLIKGAIYTDKGLIYVAKMNDKGDLKLI